MPFFGLKTLTENSARNPARNRAAARTGLAGDDIDIDTVEAVRNSQIDSPALNDVGFGNCGHFFFLVPFGIAAPFLLNFGQKAVFLTF